jgi:cytochrome b pre-mRNA-processing protein 3
MILRLFPRKRPETTIRSLYGAIVAQARQPVFYREYGVPDTVNGRFDMIVLHLVLALERTEAAGEPARTLGQDVFDRFCSEMDGHFRELGVSDLKVPKEMREMAQAFYGRRSVYHAALAAPGDAALEAALARNIFPGDAGDAPRLARYVRAAWQTLQRSDFARGELRWPDPDSIEASPAVHEQG